MESKLDIEADPKFKSFDKTILKRMNYLCSVENGLQQVTSEVSKN